MANKFGICEWVLAINGPAAIRFAGEIGFDGIQLGDLGGAGNRFPMNDPRIQEVYRETGKRYNIEFQSLHLFTLVRDGHLRFLPESGEGMRGLQSIRKGLEACAALKIPILQLTSFDACSIVNDYDCENTAKMLRKACDMAKPMGLRIGYESITPTTKIAEILEYVGSDLVLCYDILNPIKFLKGDPAEEIPLFAKSIDHIHVKDAPRNMQGFCRLGTGHGKYRESIAKLKEIGFSGWYITENFYHNTSWGGDTSALDLAAQDLAVMRDTIGV